jgi:hypothetical protein
LKIASISALGVFSSSKPIARATFLNSSSEIVPDLSTSAWRKRASVELRFFLI